MDDVFARYQKALRDGHQLAAEGRFKAALEEYQEAAKVADERALPHVCVGGMYLRLGKAREALAAYERALEREPGDIDALTGRAAALLAAGRRAEAAAAKEELNVQRAAPPELASVPAALRTPLSPAETLAIAGEQARAAGEVPAAIDAWLSEANEHAAVQHYDAAIDAAIRALSLAPGEARVHLELTRIYRQRGWAAEAREHIDGLRRLLELTPDPELESALEELSAARG